MNITSRWKPRPRWLAQQLILIGLMLLTSAGLAGCGREKATDTGNLNVTVIPAPGKDGQTVTVQLTDRSGQPVTDARGQH